MKFTGTVLPDPVSPPYISGVLIHCRIKIRYDADLITI